MNDLSELIQLRSAQYEDLESNELMKLQEKFDALKSLLLPTVPSSFQLEASIILGITIQHLPEFLEDNLLMDNLLTGLRQVEDKETLCSVLLALGEVASSNLKRRDYLWLHNVESHLVSLPADLEIRRSMLRALSCHLALKPSPVPISFMTFLPLVSSALESNDSKTISHASFVFAYLPLHYFAEIIRADATLPQTFINLMLHTSKEVVLPAVLVVGNIICGDDQQTQLMIDLQVIPSLLWLVDYPDKQVQAYAAWVLSNIAAGNEYQLQTVIDSGVIPKVKGFLHDGSPLEERRKVEKGKKGMVEKDRFDDAVWLIANACAGGSPHQLQYLLNEDILTSLYVVLQRNKVLRHAIISTALEGFETLIHRAVKNVDIGLPDILTPFLKGCNMKQLFDELDDLPLSVTAGRIKAIEKMIYPFL